MSIATIQTKKTHHSSAKKYPTNGHHSSQKKETDEYN